MNTNLRRCLAEGGGRSAAALREVVGSGGSGAEEAVTQWRPGRLAVRAGYKNRTTVGSYKLIGNASVITFVSLHLLPFSPCKVARTANGANLSLGKIGSVEKNFFCGALSGSLNQNKAQCEPLIPLQLFLLQQQQLELCWSHELASER